MKKLTYILFTILITLNVNAWKVATFVTGTLEDPNGVTCCVKMIHLYFANDGTFVGYGVSNGTVVGVESCCPSSGTITFNDGLDLQIQAELLEFSQGSEFETSVQNALHDYSLFEQGHWEDLIISPNPPTNGSFQISFDSDLQEQYELEIRDFNLNVVSLETVYADIGINSITINYTQWPTNPNYQYTIRLVSQNQGFGGVLIIIP